MVRIESGAAPGARARQGRFSMKVVVDFNKCTGLGICESMAPDLFEVNEDGALVLLKEDITDDELQSVEEAVAGCPTEALRIER
ncbi:MAG: ferredoxin [Mycobacterium sp.]|jgi:ferredoxin|nr:ferredoxin [Mycobacterium sp.]